MESINEQFLTLAKQMLPLHPVLCDVGSRDALEGIFLCQALEASELHVFEPNPEAAAICRDNLAQVDACKVFFNEAAVSDTCGSVDFFRVDTALSANKDIGFSSLLKINPAYTRRRSNIVQQQLTVSATTLAAYFVSRQPPDLLWIDAEGAELMVLRGAINLLPDVKIIHLEVSFRPMQVDKPLFAEVARFLRRHHFKFYCFTEVSAIRGFLYRHRMLPNPPWRLNAIFVRSN